MDEQEAPPSRNPKQPSLCDECGSNPWKYRCPGCSILTCSLPCVKSHKERTSCTGKRNRAEFVPLAQFDDRRLISDYELLEETKRVAESAHRAIVGFGSNIRFQLPTRLRMLRSAAHRRRTRLLVLPLGMSKRDKNQSRYNQRNNCIYWTVEWRFHSTDIILMDHGVDEHVNLSTVIEKHLAPSPWNNQLRPFRATGLDVLKFFIRKNEKGTNSPYRKLDMNVPMCRQLENTVIVEYPVIYVFLPSESIDFQVEEATSFVKDKEPPHSASSISSPKGVLFREEEIEEGELPTDTQVVDLLDCRFSESNQHNQIDKVDILSGKEEVHQDKQVRASVAPNLEPLHLEKQYTTIAQNNSHMSGVASEKLCEDFKFDFEQELKDAYSNLIGEMDPDDFLCFDGDYTVEETEMRDNALCFGGSFFGDDELEEGEIPTYLNTGNASVD